MSCSNTQDRVEPTRARAKRPSWRPSPMWSSLLTPEMARGAAFSAARAHRFCCNGPVAGRYLWPNRDWRRRVSIACRLSARSNWWPAGPAARTD